MRVGIEQWQASPGLSDHWGRCGLLCNQASVDANLRETWEIAHELLGERLVSLFGPQHGFVSTVQDNMIETSHLRHAPTGLPIHSLYSETREPTPEMLADLDTIICDLQIVGCRIYTWKSTVAGCLRQAKTAGKRVVVLDRPNPLGGVQVEGRVLDENATSFVGQFPIPMRHGLSIGEAARHFNESIGAELEVVPLEGWNPAHHWRQLGREWVLTSPNLPTIDPVYVFPGTVMLEGTMISEGRGTGLPFQFIGHPKISDPSALVRRVNEIAGDCGVYLRPTAFEPTSQKWAGESCQGLQIHLRDYDRIRSYRLTVALIRAFIETLGNDYRWKEPPYEYDYETLPIKLIVGNLEADQKFLGADFSIDDDYWHAGIEDYIERVKPALLYPREMQKWV